METPKYTRTCGGGSSGGGGSGGGRGGGGGGGGGGCGGGGGGRKGVGRPTKGPKPVKVPRRGLGVAQLEKLRLEEEQKNTNANAIAIAKASLANSPMHLQSPNLGHSIQTSSNSVPSSTFPFVNNVNGLQFWPHHGFESVKTGDSGLTFASGLSYESNSIRPLPNWVQRTQQQQPSSSMVSVYSRASSSSSVPHYSFEPPSNPNYIGSYVSKRREEMMIGFKRPNPFSLDIPPMSSSNSTPLPSPNPMKASETIPPWSRRSFNLDFVNSTLSEIPSASVSNSELTFRKSKKEKSFGDFLTLAPPTQCPHSNLRSPSTSLSLHYQGNMVDQVAPRSGHHQFNQQPQRWYNSIPPAENVGQTGQQSSRFQNRDAEEEEEESIDLSLKL